MNSAQNTIPSIVNEIVYSKWKIAHGMENCTMDEKWHVDEKWIADEISEQQFQQPHSPLQYFYHSHLALQWSKQSAVCCVVLKKVKSLFQTLHFWIFLLFIFGCLDILLYACLYSLLYILQQLKLTFYISMYAYL